MTNDTGAAAEGRGPVIIHKSDKRRRLAAIIAVGSLAAAGVIGGTMAAFVDHEYAGLNNTADQGGYAAAKWNLQIRADDDATWVDTTAPDTKGVADNLATDTGVPINLAIDGANNLIPGDQGTDAKTTFQVRNEDTSTQNAQITDFKLMVDPTAGTTDAALQSALRFDVTRDGQVVATDATYDQLADGIGLGVDQPILAPGAIVTYTVTVDLPEQGGAVQDAALQGMHAYLVADVDGTSTTAAATVN